jgi:hypothetical protein
LTYTVIDHIQPDTPGDSHHLFIKLAVGVYDHFVRASLAGKRGFFRRSIGASYLIGLDSALI